MYSALWSPMFAISYRFGFEMHKLLVIGFSLLLVGLGTAFASTGEAGGVERQHRILLVLWRGATEAEAALKQGLTASGLDVAVTELDPGQDRTALATTLRDRRQELVSGHYDLIYTYGTTATQMTLAVVRNRVPVLFNAVFDPVGAGVVDDPAAPGLGATGVSNGVPAAVQFDRLRRMVPVRRLAVLYNARESNAALNERMVREWSAGTDLQILSIPVSSDDKSLKRVLEEIAGGLIQVDAVYAGPDSYLISKAADIHAVIGRKVHLLGASEAFVDAGWLAAVAPDARSLGVAAAELATALLQERPIGQLPVRQPPPRLFVSQAAAAAAGITPPGDAVVKP